MRHSGRQMLDKAKKELGRVDEGGTMSGFLYPKLRLMSCLSNEEVQSSQPELRPVVVSLSV